MLHVKQRFHADSVPCQEERSCFFLKNRQSKNPVDFLQHFLFPGRIRPQHQRAVAQVPAFMKFVAQFLPVEHRPVEAEYISFTIPIKFRHFHISADTVPVCVQKGAFLLTVNTFRIRAAALHGLQHCFFRFFADGQIYCSGNCAHGHHFPFR